MTGRRRTFKAHAILARCDGIAACPYPTLPYPFSITQLHQGDGLCGRGRASARVSCSSARRRVSALSCHEPRGAAPLPPSVAAPVIAIEYRLAAARRTSSCARTRLGKRRPLRSAPRRRVRHHRSHDRN